MAQRVVTHLIDDISGMEILDGQGETLTFSLDGTTYEIDLSAENAEQLRAVITGYAAYARRVGRATGRSATKIYLEASNSEVKAWARSNGYEVADRGQVPKHVREAFKAAQGR